MCCPNCSILQKISVYQMILSKHVKSGHYQPAIEKPSECRFAGGPIVTRGGIMAAFLFSKCMLD